MEKKFILTDENIIHKGKTLYRIQALKDFGDIKKGDLGGFIESEDNLSHEGNCWVYKGSMIYDNAKVFNNAQIRDSEIFGGSKVYNNAIVSGCIVTEYAKIYNNADVYYSKVFANVKIYGNALVYECEVFGNSEIYESSKIRKCIVSENSKIYDTAFICNYSNLSSIKICGNAKIHKSFTIIIKNEIKKHINICSDANITKNRDIYSPRMKCHLKGNITFFKDINNDICISLNWFKGTVNEFKKTMNSLKLNKANINKYLNLIERAESYIGI